MAYVRRRWVAHHRRYIVEDKYHTQRMMPEKKSIRERRRPRTGLGTSQKQAKINARQRAERLSRLILDNFESGDWYVTFTLDSELTEDAIKTAYGKMTRELRRWYKKRGVICKYIAVLENLKNGGRKHGHILLPAVPDASFQEMRRALKKAWPQGDVYLKPYAGEVMDAFRLASYYVKEEVKVDRRTKAGKACEEQDAQPMRGRLMTSRNLLRTEPTKEPIRTAETYRETIKAPRGYHVVVELSYNGFTEEGYPYQHAVYEADELQEEKQHDHHHHRKPERRRRQDRDRDQRELPARRRTRQEGPARRQ